MKRKDILIIVIILIWTIVQSGLLLLSEENWRDAVTWVNPVMVVILAIILMLQASCKKFRDWLNK